MDYCDFSFRGETLSSKGYTMCEFDSSSSPSVTDTDSQREYVSYSRMGGKKHPILYHKYNDALSMEFSICKLDTSDSPVISAKEAADIKRWLHSLTPMKLTVGGDDFNGILWYGMFNVEEVRQGWERVGFRLKFTATTPFAYKERTVHRGNVVAGGSVTIDDVSDEEGYIYPYVTIIPKAAGRLEIKNEFDFRTTIIENCVVDEEIVLTEDMQISSTNKARNIANNFNYRFIRINNRYGKSENKYVFSLPCDYSIAYFPIAKVVI